MPNLCRFTRTREMRPDVQVRPVAWLVFQFTRTREMRRRLVIGVHNLGYLSIHAHAREVQRSARRSSTRSRIFQFTRTRARCNHEAPGELPVQAHFDSRTRARCNVLGGSVADIFQVISIHAHAREMRRLT